MGAQTRNSTRGKLFTTFLAVGSAATVAGLGTFGSFTATTSASESVSSGTVQIALGATGASTNRMDVAATGLVPGDTVERSVDLTVNGSEDLSGVTLTTTATTSSVLDTDAANGLQMVVDMCSVPWTEAGTSPAYTYTCSGTTTTLLASSPVIGSNLPLSGVATTTGSTSHLRVTLTLPTTAGNTFQGQSSTVQFTFTGMQRAATSR